MSLKVQLLFALTTEEKITIYQSSNKKYPLLALLQISFHYKLIKLEFLLLNFLIQTNSTKVEISTFAR